MIGRLTRLRGRLSSHWLASVFAMAYLLVSILLGVALLAAPKVAGGTAAPVASTPTIDYPDSTDDPTIPVPGAPDDSGPTGTTTTTPSPTTTTTTPYAPAGYQPVTGPAGLRTVIPVGWHSTRTTGPGAMQATDPADPARFVKYGGSVAPNVGIEPAHIQYENVFATRTPDYKRLDLSSASYGGHDAVLWEFEHRDRGDVQHVRSLYWRANGKEYVVLASAPANRWNAMVPIYQTMIANASP